MNNTGFYLVQQLLLVLLPRFRDVASFPPYCLCCHIWQHYFLCWYPR